MYILGPMVENTKVNISKIRNMDKELNLFQLARNIQVDGKMECNMEKQCLQLIKEKSKEVFGKMERDRNG